MQTKIIFVLAVSILLILFLSQEAKANDVYKIEMPVNLKVPCINNGTLCSASATCNISVINPQTKALVNNTRMTNQIAYHNYSLSSNQVNTTGEYTGIVTCLDGSSTGFNTFNFDVTRSGEILGTSGAIVYALLTLACLIVFSLGFYFSIAIPYGDIRDTENSILRVTRTKYIKMVFISITYGMFTWFLNLLIGLSDNYLNLGIFFGFVAFLFNVLISLAFPFFVIIFVWSIFEMIRDVNKRNYIKKFGRIKFGR